MTSHARALVLSSLGIAASIFACYTAPEGVASLTGDGGSAPTSPDAGVDEDEDEDPRVECPAGETACDGACTQTKVDTNHCGSCGVVCSETARYCVTGTCSATCPFTDCSGACVDTETDASHCGACGNACTGGKVCIDGACTCGSSPVTLSTNQSEIFTPSCTGGSCHSENGKKGIDLSSTDLSHQTLVNERASCGGKTLVVPGDVDASYLMNKLTGIGMCSGSKMPKGPGLSASELDAVRNWICNGAEND